MSNFKRGDILIGKKRGFKKAYHPIVYIDGPDYAPLAVILTHADDNKFPCNIKLSKTYGGNQMLSYFVAHLIEKMSEWGPYKKISELDKKDMILIENQISKNPITWKHYLAYTKNGCPDHK